MRVPENLLDPKERERRASRRRAHRQSERQEASQSLNDTISDKRPMIIVGLLVMMIVVGVMLAGRSTVELRPAYRPDVQVMAAKDLEALRIALERFRFDCKRYPTTREGLRSLIYDRNFIGWRGVYVSRLRPDPWKRPYVYESDGHSLTLLSTGKDGVRGTQDDIIPEPPTVEQVAGVSNYWSIRPVEELDSGGSGNASDE
jgi:general secretion pathway protein G